MYNWYLLSLQSFIIHTTQVNILYIALPLIKSKSTYLAPSSCDGKSTSVPGCSYTVPFLSPVVPAHPSPPSSTPSGFSPEPNVLLIRTHPNPFPVSRTVTVLWHLLQTDSGLETPFAFLIFYNNLLVAAYFFLYIKTTLLTGVYVFWKGPTKFATVR
jgi:hypothetical protein